MKTGDKSLVCSRSLHVVKFGANLLVTNPYGKTSFLPVINVNVLQE